MKEYRRVPLTMLRKRLKVDEYEAETPYDSLEWKPKKVRLLLNQHVGRQGSPVVEKGAAVAKSDLIATVGEKDLGVNIHASISGTVTAVEDSYVEIEG
jgi:Na+-translocating ferredoxin:NAD+ oxidoreductase RnfC subunit